MNKRAIIKTVAALSAATIVFAGIGYYAVFTTNNVKILNAINGAANLIVTENEKNGLYTFSTEGERKSKTEYDFFYHYTISEVYKENPTTVYLKRYKIVYDLKKHAAFSYVSE